MKPDSVDRINQWIKDNRITKYELKYRIGKKKGLFNCREHGEFTQIIDVFKRGSLGCKECDHENRKIILKKITIDDYLERIDNFLVSIGLEKGRYSIVGETDNFLNVKCNLHSGRTLPWKKNRLQKHLPCPECQSKRISKGKSRTANEIQTILNEEFKKLANGKPLVELLSKNPKPNKTRQHKWFRCNKPGHGGKVFEQLLDSALHGHVSCPLCHKEFKSNRTKNKLSYGYIKKIVNEIYDGQFRMPNADEVDYENTHTIIKHIYCKVCKREFPSSIQRLVYKRRGCKWIDCDSKKTSKMEKFIYKLLKENSIKSIPQYKLDQYSVDFFLSDFNLIIEYDGKHHFEHIFGTVEDFEDVQRRDREKNKLAKGKNYNLVRISYENNNNQIDEIIRDVITKVTKDKAEQLSYGSAYSKLILPAHNQIIFS